jgi:hypothetical protein
MMRFLRANPLCFLAVGLSLSAASGTDSRPLDVVHFWDDAGSIKPLEKAEIVPVSSSAANPATWEIKGARSTFRVKRAPALLFLVRIAESERPGKIQLFRLTGSGARRPYPPRDAWRTATLSVTSAGDSIGLAPVGELNEGEYAFVRAGSNEAYCFGIDPPKWE